MERTKKEIQKKDVLKKEYNFEKLRKIMNKEGNDGLHIACERGHHKVVCSLMRKGEYIAKNKDKKETG